MAAAKSSAPMSRGDVVSDVAAETNMPPAQVDQVIRAFEGSLKRTLSSGGEVRMAGLGTFKISDRAARMGRNPKTGEALQIKASKNVRFSAGKAFKDAIGGGSGAKAGAGKAASGKAASGKAASAKAASAKAAPAAKPSSAAKAAPAKSASAAKAAPAKAAPVKAAAPSKASSSKEAAITKAEASKGGKKGGKK